MRVRYVTLTRDLIRQGHVILKVNYLISGPIHAGDILLFWLIGSRKSMACGPYTWPGRVTLYVKVT